MKYLKYLLFVVLILSFVLVSCKKDSTTGPTGASALQGSWTFVDAITGYFFTTNSNQEAINPDFGDGEITVTGTYNSVMTFIGVDYDFNPPALIAMDFWSDINNSYILMIDASGATDEGTFVVAPSDGSDWIIFEGTVSYTFDGTTLTVNQSVLTDAVTNNTVTISGTILIIKKNIPANTPTFITYMPSGIFASVLGVTQTVEINDDGTYTLTGTFDGDMDTETGTWVVDGNTVMIITMVDGKPDTTYAEFVVTGDQMTWTMIEDVCKVAAEGEGNCLRDLEEEWSMDQGSLTKAEFQMQVVYNKAVAKTSSIQTRYSLTDFQKNYKTIIENNREKYRNLRKTM